MDGGATPTLLVAVDLLIFVPQVALEFYSINVVLKFAYLIQKVTLTNAVLLDLIGADQFILIKIHVGLLNELAGIFASYKSPCIDWAKKAPDLNWTNEIL